MDVKKVIDFAASQIGYKETGTNITKYAKFFDEKYPDFYNTRKQGAEWCDIFVDYCMVMTYGYENALKLLCQPEKSCGAGCSYSFDYYKKKGRTGNTPKVGAQVFFKKSKTDKKPCHTGLVVAVDGKKVTTIEGNKSNMVKKCTYTTDTKIFGYGYPDYDADATQGNSEPNTATTDKPKETTTAEKPKETAKPKTESPKKYTVVAKSGLNVRQGPGTQHPKIKPALDYGDTIEVSKIENGWAKLADRAGYVCTGMNGKIYIQQKK